MVDNEGNDTKNYMELDEVELKKFVNEILHGVKDAEHKIFLVTVTDSETGEIVKEDIPCKRTVLKKKGGYMGELKKFNGGYVRIPTGGDVSKKYTHGFTVTESGYLYQIIQNVDSLGRFKYGNNSSQYCRKPEDICMMLGISKRTFQRLYKKFIDNNIIRTVQIKGGTEGYNKEFLLFNPSLVLNGVYWDRLSVIVWEDVIIADKLLTEAQVKKILNYKGNKFSEGTEIIVK